MSKATIGASLIAVIAAGLAFFSFLNPCFMCDACRRSDLDVSEDGIVQEHSSAVMDMVMTGFGEKKASPTLLDFPAAADMPAAQFASRPRRPIYLTSLAVPSAGVLSFLTGGEGVYRPNSAAAVTYGVKLQLDLAADENDLKQRFLLGGDAGGADIMAVSLERFIANLPELLQVRPKIFLLLAYSRGSLRLVSIDEKDISALKEASIAYVPGGGGRYFLTWRLLKEGIAPGNISWRQEASQANVLRSLKSGKTRAALVQSAAIGSGEDELNETTDILEEGAENVEYETVPAEVLSAPTAALCDAGVPEADPQKKSDDTAPSPDDRNGQRAESADSPEAVSAHLRRLASTADAPLLSPLVLIVRGDFAVRYPEMLRRVAKAVIAEGAVAAESPLPAARRMRDIYPDFETPEELLALASEEPAATLAENKAFFGLSKASTPVPFKDLLHSQIRVLRSMGILSGEIRGASAESLFLKAPLDSLSDKIIASAKSASRAARQKGRIKDLTASQEASTPETEAANLPAEEQNKRNSPSESTSESVIDSSEAAAGSPASEPGKDSAAAQENQLENH